MSPLATAFPSPCCASDWTVVNPGAVHRTYTAIIAACAACGAEWGLRLDAYRLTDAPAGHGKPRRRRPVTLAEGDQLAAAVLDLITTLKEGTAA